MGLESIQVGGGKICLGNGWPGEWLAWGMVGLGNGWPGEWLAWGMVGLGNGWPGEWLAWGMVGHMNQYLRHHHPCMHACMVLSVTTKESS